MSSPSCRVLAAIEAELGRQGAKLDRILAALEARQPQRRDTALDERLVSTLAVVFGAAVFAVGDIEASGNPELRAVVARLDSRLIGAWLKRLRDQPIAGYMVRRIGRDDAGALWQLSVSAISHTARRPSRDRGAP